MTSLFSNHSFHKSKFALKCNCRPRNGRESLRNKRKGQIRLVGRCGSLWVVPGFSNYALCKAKYPNALCRSGLRRPLSQYLIFSENVSRSNRFLDSAVFVRNKINKVFGSDSSAIADVYYSLMCDHTECEYHRERWLEVSVVQVPDT